jgi:hypothetical protein
MFGGYGWWLWLVVMVGGAKSNGSKQAVLLV